MTRNRWLFFLKMMLQGAGCFWILDIILHAIPGKDFSSIQVLSMTIILPILCVKRLFIYSYGKDIQISPLRAASAMLLGIWLFGPLATMISATFSGGGFSHSSLELWIGLVLFTVLFPACTFMMSAYDGALFALFLITIVLPIFGVFLTRKRKLKEGVPNSI